MGFGQRAQLIKLARPDIMGWIYSAGLLAQLGSDVDITGSRQIAQLLHRVSEVGLVLQLDTDDNGFCQGLFHTNIILQYII
ncbi:hypothetical protein D3C78_958660 [compost metagenome]